MPTKLTTTRKRLLLAAATLLLTTLTIGAARSTVKEADCAAGCPTASPCEPCPDCPLSGCPKRAS